MAAPLRYSELHVTGTERITPHMQRVTFGGEDLAEFTYVCPDQHSKLFFPRQPGQRPWIPPMPEDGDVARWHQNYLAMPEAERPWLRSYTIRRHYPERQEIDIDFVLHGDGDGPAAVWAAAAQTGDVVGMLGPQLSHFRTPGEHDWKLIVGDETALPAIGALLEDLKPGERAVVYAEVADAAEEQNLATEGEAEAHWLHRDGLPPGESGVLLDAVRAAEFPPGPVFAWVAGESASVRALRRHLANDRGIDKRAIAFTGYWRFHLTHDDAPTDADIADATEMLEGAGVED